MGSYLGLSGGSWLMPRGGLRVPWHCPPLCAALPAGTGGTRQGGHFSTPSSICSSTRAPTHLSVSASVHLPTLGWSRVLGTGTCPSFATVLPEVVAAGCGGVTMPEPGEWYHLPGLTGVRLPWCLVPLCPLGANKGACCLGCRVQAR